MAFSCFAKARTLVIYSNVRPSVNENLVNLKGLLANTIAGSVCGGSGANEKDLEY